MSEFQGRARLLKTRAMLEFLAPVLSRRGSEMSPLDLLQRFLFSLLLWREDRGGTSTSRTGIAWSVRNRVTNPTYWGNSWLSVIMHPFAYSSFNRNDPNAVKFPSGPDDQNWSDCCSIAQTVMDNPTDDPTQGATHYYTGDTTPEWANDPRSIHTVDIDGVHFYKVP